MQIASLENQNSQKRRTLALGRSFLPHHLDKIKIAKRLKISIANEQIKIRNTQTEKKIPFQNNMHLPPVIFTDNFKTNQQISNSTFCGQVFSPIKKGIKTPSSVSEKKNENSKIISKSGFHRINKKNDETIIRFDSNESFYYLQEMKIINSYLKQQILQKRLNMLSKQKGKSQLRIYKDDIHKLIVHRFGKDRITTLLNTQYIQDYDSILKTMKQLTTLKQQQMLILSFLIMDQNKDGLITAVDLMGILGVKKQSTSFNQLIAHDAIKLIEYVQTMKKQNVEINDSADNSILKDQKLTFMTYRINKIKQLKSQANSQIQKASIISGRAHQRLYSLQSDSQADTKLQEQKIKLSFQQIIMKMIKSNQDKNKSLLGKNQTFSINFQRYSSIFCNQVPYVFLDFLYLFGAIELPNIKYLPIDIQAVLFSHQKELRQSKQQNKMVKILKRLQQMNNFKRQLKTLRINTQF